MRDGQCYALQLYITGVHYMYSDPSTIRSLATETNLKHKTGPSRINLLFHYCIDLSAKADSFIRTKSVRKMAKWVALY